jgi:cytoskeletal protein CcmA (bactofilin family)
MVIQEKLQQPISHSELKETTISPDAEFKGSLNSRIRSASTELRGGDRLAGDPLSSQERLVKAEIHVGNHRRRGEGRGNVTCDNKVELRSTAKMFGDIQAARLTIAEGVSIVGKCSVTTQKGGPEIKPAGPPRPEFKKGREERGGVAGD